MIDAIAGKINEALKLDNATEKTEQLLLLKEKNKTFFGNISNHESNKSLTALTIGGGIAVGMCFVAALAALPMTFAVFPVAILGIGVGIGSQFVSNRVTAEENQKTFEETINKEVCGLFEAHPQEVANSSRFRQAIGKVFNVKSTPEGDVTAPTSPAANRAEAPKH
ncbi:MAG: hypothetical protein HY052_00270 [Proteobacteria bacterium]|nr:hypothetical protein [Pseudomonadota bacterium]